MDALRRERNEKQRKCSHIEWSVLVPFLVRLIERISGERTMTVKFLSRSDSALPVSLISSATWKKPPKQLPKSVVAYAKAIGFQGATGSLVLAPDRTGELQHVLLGIGDGEEPFIGGKLAKDLPPGTYEIVDNGGLDPTMLALGIGLDQYKFDRYLKPGGNKSAAKFVWPMGSDSAEVDRILEGMFLTRDLINTPTPDMTPLDLADAATNLARKFNAKVSIVNDLERLAEEFPLVHAVGRASVHKPCLIDMTWGRADAPKVTLVGKGVCYDTGGLSMKPTSGMLLMKKDMAGGASVLGLAAIIMASGLDVRLRVIVPAAENAVSGDSFRPGDVLQSRAGLTIEVTNTDAEGRLVLADALALADEEAPDLLIDMATLTGASKVGLGVELPAFFCANDEFAREACSLSLAVSDPFWHMPLWKSYMGALSSEIADLSNMGSGPFADGIHAALFLQKFVKKAKIWAHLDLMSWNGSAKPGRPFGGDGQAVRALYEMLKARYA